jgi:protein-S-isoprenylcysteine O-methyltransferase Ste14
MLYYIPILELPILILLVLIRSAMLRRHGIKVIVFGITDKTDFNIIPVVLLFVYAMLAGICGWPFPPFLTNLFWKIEFLSIWAIVLCSVSLIWFAVTLKIFGKSFRVGIDENTNEKLITNGTFAISRNPIYLAFISFFFGMFWAYPNIVLSVFLALIIIAIHRQILREEKFLANHYGKEYEDYCAKVRRYI